MKNPATEEEDPLTLVDATGGAAIYGDPDPEDFKKRAKAPGFPAKPVRLTRAFNSPLRWVRAELIAHRNQLIASRDQQAAELSSRARALARRSWSSERRGARARKREAEVE